MKDITKEILDTVCDDVCVAVRKHNYRDNDKKATKEEIQTKFSWETVKDARDWVNVNNNKLPRGYSSDVLLYPDGGLLRHIQKRVPPPLSSRARAEPNIFIWLGDLNTERAVATTDLEGWTMQIQMEIAERELSGALPSIPVIQNALMVSNERRRRRKKSVKTTANGREWVVPEDEFADGYDRRFALVNYPNKRGKIRLPNRGLILDIDFFRADGVSVYDEWRQRFEGISEFDDPGPPRADFGDYEISLGATIITFQVTFNTYKAGHEPRVCVMVDSEGNIEQKKDEDGNPTGYAIVSNQGNIEEIVPIDENDEPQEVGGLFIY